MSEEPDHGYDNTHRAFLQSFLARATLTVDEAKPILAAILSAQNGQEVTTGDIDDPTLQTYIHSTNAAISPFDLEIRSHTHQTTRLKIYALVNTTSDSITQLATTHTPDEISFVKRVLDAMFETNNTFRTEVMAVKATEALRLAKAPGNRDEEGTQGQVGSLNMREAQRMLGAMVDEGWMECSGKEFYTLSARALMELRGWLIDTYNDDEEDVRIRFCHACKDIVTVGQRCPDLKCACRLHNHCTNRMFRATGGERCPICKKDWVDAPLVGEGAALGNRRTTNGTSSRRSTTQVGGDDDSSDDG